MKQKTVIIAGQEYVVMHTTYSDNVKRLHRDIAVHLVDSVYHEVVEAGVTDPLFSVIDLTGGDIIKFIEDCKV